MALFYFVVYALPYFPYVGDYVSYFFDDTKEAITGFAARNVVAPIAETVAEKAQSIAEEARSIAPPVTNAPSPKTQFFPFKNTQIDRPNSRLTPSVGVPSPTAAITASPIGSAKSSPESSSGNNAEPPSGCCACN